MENIMRQIFGLIMISVFKVGVQDLVQSVKLRSQFISQNQALYLKSQNLVPNNLKTIKILN